MRGILIKWLINSLAILIVTYIVRGIVVPYLRKLKQGKVKKFWNGYWIQALASLVLGIVTTLLIFPQLSITKSGVGPEALFKLFCLAPLDAKLSNGACPVRNTKYTIAPDF